MGPDFWKAAMGSSLFWPFTAFAALTWGATALRQKKAALVLRVPLSGLAVAWVFDCVGFPVV